ncbi:uncharacterized protein LOC128547421 [Mercenaria mercenaria]|uniref:uncharacterized protein LOC128547421 n=1 Tax=Mercenaria mercenaria TaxID=6596 RepID=UPI00234E46CE|nr:uncharacterized protein LOC128547421 [Mercenaria mercenaria]
MSYRSYESSSTTYDNDCSASVIGIIIFGSVIIFLLVVMQISICWICCRRDNRRDGVIIRPMDHMQTGTVLYTNNDQVQFNQTQIRSPNVHQAYNLPPITPTHRFDGQQCTASAQSSSPAVVPVGPLTTSLTAE